MHMLRLSIADDSFAMGQTTVGHIQFCKKKNLKYNNISSQAIFEYIHKNVYLYYHDQTPDQGYHCPAHDHE